MAEREDAPTCGRGLAEHAVVPAKLAELSGAYRAIAGELSAVARRMAGYRHLPMGRHDMAAMTAPANAEAFAGYVRIESELVELLEQRLKMDRAMVQ